MTHDAWHKKQNVKLHITHIWHMTPWHMTHDTWHMGTWHMTHDTWHMTHDTWHMTHDTWHMTHDSWHMTHDTCDSDTHECNLLYFQDVPIAHLKLANGSPGTQNIKIIICFSRIAKATQHEFCFLPWQCLWHATMCRWNEMDFQRSVVTRRIRSTLKLSSRVLNQLTRCAACLRPYKDEKPFPH